MSISSTSAWSSQAESQIAEFGRSASSVSQSAENANYGFIALLGLAQRLRVDLLPLTWQAARGSLEEDGRGGRGGQAKIYQSYMSPESSFVFKRFSRNSYHELVSELLMLTHEVIRKHHHIVRLEGLCWDVRNDDDVRPVLVFEKSSLGDLFYFMKAGPGKRLSIDDRLRLCVEIGVAIRDMHANNIVHGDIKPRNVIIFETGISRYIAKIGDFGFSTRFTSKDELLYMPRSRIWHAPEWHDRAFRPEDAKRMDIFSYGMVCLWMLFGVDVSLDSTGDSGQLISFDEDCDPATNCLDKWKLNGEQDELTAWAISIIPERVGSRRSDITSFFKLAIAKVPKKRELQIDVLLRLLDPARYIWGRRIDVRGLLSSRTPAWRLPKAEILVIRTAPNEENFEIPFSFSRLFLTDFRIPPFIVAELKLGTAQSQRVHRISPRKAALQLALSYAIGFGVPQDEELARQVLTQHTLDWADLESQVQAVREQANDIFEGSLSPSSVHVDSRRTSSSPNIIKKETCWKEREKSLTASAQGPEHLDTLIIKGNLARACREQGDLTRAQELDVQIFEQMVRTLGPEDPRTMVSSASLMSTNWKRRGLAQTIEAMMQVLETRKRVLGPEHQSTLSSMVEIGSAYRDQGRLLEAEKVLTQVVQMTQKVLGEEHPDTWTSMDHLAHTYQEQGKQRQAEELWTHLLSKRQRVIGAEDRDTLKILTNLGITYRRQGRLRKATDTFEHVMEIRQRTIGLDHQDTLAVMAHLALTYRDQGSDRSEQAEDLFKQVIKHSRRLFGEEDLSTLAMMNNLAGMYWTQERWTEAEELYSQEWQVRKRVLGGEHRNTLTCTENSAWTYQRQGRQEQAKRLFIHVWETRSRVRGAEDPDTVEAKKNLEWL